MYPDIFQRFSGGELSKGLASAVILDDKKGMPSHYLSTNYHFFNLDPAVIPTAIPGHSPVTQSKCQ